MNPIVESLNFYLALGGIIAILTTAILIVDEKRDRVLAPYVQKYGLIAAFLIALDGAIFALVYSDVFGFVPCGFCWFERIFLFSQVFLLGGAIYFKDALFARYGIILSVIGLIISLYHHYIQIGGNAFVKCPAAGTVDCAKRIMFEFDFMTFPLLAASSFALLSALYHYILRSK